MGAEKFSEFYITLHYNKLKVSEKNHKDTHTSVHTPTYTHTYRRTGLKEPRVLWIPPVQNVNTGGPVNVECWCNSPRQERICATYGYRMKTSLIACPPCPTLTDALIKI